tara:strand:+ start:95 stop:250 length:156 start_codon:yes stop_codon:yes gene_type:complete
VSKQKWVKIKLRMKKHEQEIDRDNTVQKKKQCRDNKQSIIIRDTGRNKKSI